MADKQLTESAWKAFAKGKGYKDANFLSALADWAKAEKKPAEAQLEALEEIDKQCELLKKAHKSDKDLGDYLGDVEKSVAKARKAAEQLAKEQTDDEEPDEPVLLTSKMIPLVRLLRKGDPMHVLLGNAGKQTAVLIMRKPIATNRRKLLLDYMQLGGGVKYIKGTAQLAPDGKAVVFALETSAGAGFAKRIRQAILDQTGQRLKLKCRAADSGQEEDDGEADVPEDDEGIAIGMPDGQSEGEPSTTPPDPQALRFRERLSGLQQRIDAVLKANAPEAQKIRAVREFAQGKADVQDFAAAMRSLEMLETLLGAAEKAMGRAQGEGETAGGGSDSEPKSGDVDPARAFNARLSALMPRVKEAIAVGGPLASDVRQRVAQAGDAATKSRDYDLAGTLLDEAEELLGQMAASRSGSGETGYEGLVAYRAALLAYRSAASTVAAQIDRLKQAIPAQLPGEQELAEELSQALKELHDDYLELVDEALAASENKQSPVTAALAASLDAYANQIVSNPLVRHADNNPFGVDVSIGRTLGDALAEIQDTMPARR